ncbi:Ran GTPase-activating protein [Entamoeba histolytica HM-3:IMSS]|uniref:Ran GTPase-activating protein, putative n=2 Tax=Entamoeba histolytica TaxID=5759 RepID=M2R585_ENTHI|nr:Ran GTPase-activating protein, putative [Entamoeba histolytica KU27]EMS11319.1 Ran GTPase-activating protein [Entamoeba histolytica HM-3:IMSS]
MSATEADKNPITLNTTSTLDDPEAEADIHFEPVVQLKEISQPKSEEETKFEARALCMRYDADAKEWKERGRGDIKILRHPKTQYSRVILIRDQIFKLACDHFCHPKVVLKDVPTNDKCIMYAVGKDFAQETPCQMLFTFRFNTAEICKQFKEAFQAAQKEMEEVFNKKD